MAELTGDAPLRRVGLFGGSFDPVHQGHLALGLTAMAELALSELRWIPTGHAWQKARPLTAGAHRMAMLAELLRHTPHQIVDDIEVQRPGPSYTIDTVVALHERLAPADYYLIIGQDQYENLHTWHRWRDLLGLVTLAVVARDGQAPRAPALQAVPHRLRVINMPAVAVSATEIRHRLATGETPDALSPSLISPVTARYIAAHALYRAQP